MGVATTDAIAVGMYLSLLLMAALTRSQLP